MTEQPTFDFSAPPCEDPDDMPGAPPRMDSRDAQRAAETGIRRSYEQTPDEWKERAYTVLEQLAIDRAEIVSDDVWTAGLDRPPNSATSLGGVFRRAAKAGIIRKTDRVRTTAQVASHGSPMTVWQSCLFQ